MDTGDLEAQICGSRQAWDVRLISVGALLRLLRVKEAVEDPATIQRIHAILIPREFTRLDDIVDVAFSTVEEAQTENPEIEAASVTPSPSEIPERTGPKFIPVKFHDNCARRLEEVLGTTLVKVSKSTFSSPDKKIRVTCCPERLPLRGRNTSAGAGKELAGATVLPPNSRSEADHDQTLQEMTGGSRDVETTLL